MADQKLKGRLVRFPVLVDEISFEHGVYSLAANSSGSKIAVGTKGMIGLYHVQVLDGVKYLSHFASYASERAEPDESIFTDLAFTADDWLACTEFDGIAASDFWLDSNQRGFLERSEPGRARSLLALHGRSYSLSVKGHEVAVVSA
jgi:hypothetical protein